MAPIAGKLVAPLLSALLAQQQVLSEANQLSALLDGLKGKTQLSCHEVCRAAGHGFRSYSSSWDNSNYVAKCHCSGETLQVDCELGSDWQFESCCIQGKTGCGQSDKPDSEEEEMREVVDELPEITWEDADIDTVPDCPKCPGAQHELLKHEQASVLALHNKMRKAVGTPPLKWNCHLMCQVQQHADKCVFAHSLAKDRDGKGGDIAAGENMASGTDGEFATWMWFSEYGRYPPSQHASNQALHFTAVVWKATQHLGCGVCKKAGMMGGGNFFCQYSDHQPNWNNAFEANVPKFQGTAAQYQHAGLDIEKAKEVYGQIHGWGIDTGDALTRFYTAAYDGESPAESLDGPLGFWAKTPRSALGVAGAAAACALAAVVIGLALRRRSAVGFRDIRLDYTTKDEEELACGLAEQ